MIGLTEMFGNFYEDTLAYNNLGLTFLLKFLAEYTEGELFNIVSIAFLSECIK